MAHCGKWIRRRVVELTDTSDDSVPLLHLSPDSRLYTVVTCEMVCYTFPNLTDV
ncbi:hypothetical protein WG66_014151 [Moniliophthora roreri]|nr:hypothetical protein WG66_014151 [Moniliophthora roreri]